MVIVRLLLALSLSAIGVALLLYLFTRDRRYLTFVWTVFKFSLIVLVAIFAFIIVERLLAPAVGPLL